VLSGAGGKESRAFRSRLEYANAGLAEGRRHLHTRTLFFVSNYVIMLVAWKYGFESLPLRGLPGLAIALLCAFLGLGFLTVAVIIHRGFPEEHSKASDFTRLRTTGPYAYVRHPFYSSLIALNYFASLAFLSLYGVVVSTFLLPAWWYMARSEESDLMREWGQEYADYRKATPMLFPRIRRRQKESQSSVSSLTGRPGGFS